MARLDLTGISQTAAGTFGYRITLNGRRKYVGKFPTAEDAARSRDIAVGLAAATRGGYQPDPKAMPTLAELGDALCESRKAHMAGWRTEQSRWTSRVRPYFGKMRPQEVTVEHIRNWLRIVRADISAASAASSLAVLSNIYEDLRIAHPTIANPCRNLPRDLMSGPLRDDHDPSKTPFLRRKEDIARVYEALPERFKRLFALGVQAGMRLSEARALLWSDVHLDRGIIHIQRQANRDAPGTRILKGKRSRVVPIVDSLLPLLKEWKLADGGQGLIAKPPDGREFIYISAPSDAIRGVLLDLKLNEEGLSWYECTRHTFASHWAMSGRSLRKLQAILGHSSITMTERYAHLDPGVFTADDRAAMGSGLTARVIPIRGESCEDAGNKLPMGSSLEAAKAQ